MSCPVLELAHDASRWNLDGDLLLESLEDEELAAPVGKRTLTASLARPLYREVEPQVAAAALAARARALVARSSARRALPAVAVAQARAADPACLATDLGGGAAASDAAAAPAPLDDVTRAAIEATTGRRLPAIEVVVDPALAGRDRLGEATGNVIRLAPAVAGEDDALGRRVRLHEAAHVAQAHAGDRPAATERDVEHDAHAVAAAAERGQRRDVGVRAAAGAAYGLSASEAAEAAADPEGYIREHYPELADLYDHGVDGLLQRAGDFVGTQLTPMLAATGFDQLGPAITQMLGSFKSESLAFGALTGCCECFESALASLLASFDGFLASDGAKSVQSWIARIQTAETSGLLDLLAGGFELVRPYVAPIITPIADAAIAVGEYIWKDWICYYGGLDPNLPPQQAIEKKLGEVWAAATAAFAQVKAAATALWAQLQQNPIIATLARWGSDCVKLVGALRKVQQARSRDPKVWLAILAEEMQGTIFEELIASLQTGHDTALGFADAVDQWFRGVLQQLGILGAWNTTVPYIAAAAQAVQRFFKSVSDAIASVQASFQQVLTRVADALSKMYAAVKPLLDFVVGLALAIQTAPMGLVTFAAGQIFRNLPVCYQVAITDFILDLFIHAVEWIPAIFPPTVLIRAAALGYLKTLRGAPVAQKVGAMTTIMRFVSGDVELVAGFIVGFFEGLWASSLGLVIRLCFPLIDLVPALIDFAGQLVAFVAVPFEVLYKTAQWFIDLAAGATPIDGPRKGEKPADPAPAKPGPEQPAEEAPDQEPEPEPAPGEGAPGLFEPFPAFPGFPFDVRAAFDEVMRGDGVTRADLEKFLGELNIQLAALGEQIGAEVAQKVLVALNDDSAPYALGEIVGMVAGWACGELIVFLATLGVGSIVAGGAEGLVQLGNILKSFPKLVGLLEKLRSWLRPVIAFVEKMMAKLSAALKAILKWIDDLILWAKNQLKRILAWIDDLLGKKKPKAPKPKPGLGDDDDGGDAGKIAADAAKAAWTYLTRKLDQDAVHSEDTVKDTLKKADEDGKDGVKVTTTIDHFGKDGWRVSADASDTSAKTYGDGWVNKVWKNGKETSERHYAFRNDRSLHESILADAAAAIEARELDGESEADWYRALDSYLEGTLRREVEGKVKLAGVSFEIQLEELADVEVDHEATIMLVLTPNSTSREVRKNSLDHELKAQDIATKELKNQLFTTAFLKETLEANGLPTTDNQASKYTRSWQNEIGDAKLYTWQSTRGDPLTEYTFSKALSGVRELEESESSREKYGYVNPDQKSSKGIEILQMGHIPGSPAPPADDSRYCSVVPNSPYTDFKRVDIVNGEKKTLAVLGHKYVAVLNWNEGQGGSQPGHMNPRSTNLTWNQTVSNYRGPEHYIESGEEGAELRRRGISYEVPRQSIGSHPSWWQNVTP